MKKKDPWEKYLIKNEDLVIQLGTYLRLIAPANLTEKGEEPMYVEPQGQIYRVYDRKGAGWDLELVSGDGPPHIRAMNSEVLQYFEVIPSTSATSKINGYKIEGHGLSQTVFLEKKR